MHIPLDPSAPEPMYEQIRAHLAEAILRGELGAGQALPSIRVLARDLRVSVITTTRAYNELVADGFAYAVRGKGVFVRAQQPEEVRLRALERVDAALTDAVRTARTAGLDPDALHDRLRGVLDAEEGER